MKLKTKRNGRMGRLNVKTTDEPLKLNLGSGPTKLPGFVSVDSIKFSSVDVVLDLNTPHWPWMDDSVEEIHMSHTIEHFTGEQRVHIYNEMFRVLKKGAKATLIAPYWSSGRAYGDWTHQWPPVAAFSFYYLLKDWRMKNAPHTDAEHNPKGHSCDFDVTWGFNLHPEVAVRSQEFQQDAMQWKVEACQDVIYTLVKR